MRTNEPYTFLVHQNKNMSKQIFFFDSYQVKQMCIFTRALIALNCMINWLENSQVTVVKESSAGLAKTKPWLKFKFCQFVRLVILFKVFLNVSVLVYNIRILNTYLMRTVLKLLMRRYILKSSVNCKMARDHYYYSAFIIYSISF